MYNPETIGKVISIGTRWPDIDVVTFENPEGAYNVRIDKAEADLLVYLKTIVYPKLDEKEKKDLLELISNFGNASYDDGCFDEHANDGLEI